MHTEAIIRNSKYRYTVRMDSGDVLPMSGKDILLYDLREGQEVSEEVWSEMLRSVRRDCLRRCGSLLGKRDYSGRRLRQKLTEAGYPAGIIEEVIRDLLEDGYIDDRRIAENYVRIHIKDRSRRRILTDLTRLGIGEETALEVMEEIREEAEDPEVRQIRELMRKRGFDPAAASAQERGRFMSFLYRRGYETDSIWRAIRLAESAEESFT